jgi:diadenosine tetraphosphate (Ap4A) HIT family hydrolase
MTDCPLCQTTGSSLLWENNVLRVIDAQDPVYPGFTRVIWKRHVAEMTDLSKADQRTLMKTVLEIETLQRKFLQPDKINLAAFGNMVPHLHWHIIPRWLDDAHFPQPVWAALPDTDEAGRVRHQHRRDCVAALIPAYHSAIQEKFQS